MQKGFAPLVAVIILAVVLIGGIFLWKSGPKQVSQHTGQSSNASKDTEWPMLWGQPDGSCKRSDVKFSASPMDPADIIYIEPIGELREGHIIPGDHGGFDYKTSPTSTPVKVFAPADGVLVNVERHPYNPPAGYPRDMRHYHFYLVHSCTLFTGFVHLTEFSPEILAASPQLKKLDDENGNQFTNLGVNIPVKAGQQIGTAWSFGLLGWVTVDLNHTNKGYLNPQSYKAENWRVHSVSGFDYFESSLKEKIIAKNPRKAQPQGGKIDFDIEGKAVGNWFEEGTGGLRDTNVDPKQCGNFPCPYWDGHIAFVYDFIDPMQLRVSIGHDWGLTGRTPFGVKGNSPDFKDIGIKNEMVKYELVGVKDVSREKGYDVNSSLITQNDETQVLGTMLVQLTDEGTLKVEIFPGKMKDQISEFTQKAKVYER